MNLKQSILILLMLCKTLVCLRTSSVNSTVTVNEDETNCGKLTSVGDPGFSFSFDAVCEVAPTISQVSYKDLLTATVNKTKITVRFQNPTVTGASIGTGRTIPHAHRPIGVLGLDFVASTIEAHPHAHR